jgi:anti-sigma regulatory factor (Ser/Thr protein kinase)
MNTVESSHHFRLNADLAEVPALRDLFTRACSDIGVPEDEKQAAMLILTELVNNSVEHGCKGPTDVVEGCWQINDSEIVIVVTDPGETLTGEDFKNSDPGEFAEHGRGAGLFLIQALSDELEVKRSDTGGTTIRVVKRLPPGRAA